ncbi:hypothetical protein AB0D04_40895 [Streptomyces sp. NPDC048483]|uniref:hypothetical protein n=1 Tax=Streptomyces sp. NPDC048483 TaxID=3154927 RepID=UPI00343F6C63
MELDFEPVPSGTAPSVEFACSTQPEPAPEYEKILAHGIMQELAAADTDAPDARRGAPVSARVIVRALCWNYTETCEMVFIRLGALAVREALSCIEDDREPQLIETRVRLLF